VRERIIRRVAGTMVLVSVGLALWGSPYWLALAAFVGLNLMQSSFTRFCPLEIILQKAGVGNETACADNKAASAP